MLDHRLEQFGHIGRRAAFFLQHVGESQPRIVGIRRTRVAAQHATQGRLGVVEPVESGETGAEKVQRGRLDFLGRLGFQQGGEPSRCVEQTAVEPVQFGAAIGGAMNEGAVGVDRDHLFVRGGGFVASLQRPVAFGDAERGEIVHRRRRVVGQQRPVLGNRQFIHGAAVKAVGELQPLLRVHGRGRRGRQDASGETGQRDQPVYASAADHDAPYAHQRSSGTPVAKEMFQISA